MHSLRQRRIQDHPCVCELSRVIMRSICTLHGTTLLLRLRQHRLSGVTCSSKGFEAMAHVCPRHFWPESLFGDRGHITPSRLHQNSEGAARPYLSVAIAVFHKVFRAVAMSLYRLRQSVEVLSALPSLVTGGNRIFRSINCLSSRNVNVK